MLVPVPGSKMKGDAEYDDRMPRILQELGRGRELDIRELVLMTRSVSQSHLLEDRVTIPELIASMTIVETCAEPAPATIGIFDDVLTTGRHFKAVQSVLREAPISRSRRKGAASGPGGGPINISASARDSKR
jgi:predicted amidophosphoribosyltransferase